MSDEVDLLTGAAARVHAGDGSAAEVLATLARAAALRMARPLVDDVSAVDDVAQEAVIEMLATLHRLREPAAFVAWFRLIVRKHADRHRRQNLAQARRETAEFVDATIETMDPAAIVERRSDADMVRGALARAADPDRTLVSLRYFADWSDRQLSELLGIAEGAVRKRLFDARRRLRPSLATRLDLITPTIKERPMPFDDLYGTVISADDALSRVPAPPTVNPPSSWLPLVTGLPVLDVLNPLPRGGIAEFRTGSLYLLSELIGSTTAGGPAVMVAVGTHRPNAAGFYNRFTSLVKPTETGPLTIVIYERDGRDEEAVRAGGSLAAAIAEDGTDVVLATS